jgi:hypothetical protein
MQNIFSVKSNHYLMKIINLKTLLFKLTDKFEVKTFISIIQEQEELTIQLIRRYDS